MGEELKRMKGLEVLTKARVCMWRGGQLCYGDPVPIQDAFEAVRLNNTPSQNRDIDGVPLTEFGSIVAHPTQERELHPFEIPEHLKTGPVGRG